MNPTHEYPRTLLSYVAWWFRPTCVYCGARKPLLTAMCDRCEQVHEGDS
jgi:hypothetical protein